MASCVWSPMVSMLRRVAHRAVPRRAAVTGSAGGAAAGRAVAPRVVRWSMVCLAGAMPALPLLLSEGTASPAPGPGVPPVAEAGPLPSPGLPEAAWLRTGPIRILDADALLSGRPAEPSLSSPDLHMPGAFTTLSGWPLRHDEWPSEFGGPDAWRQQPPVEVSEPSSAALLASFAMLAWPWRRARRRCEARPA